MQLLHLTASSELADLLRKLFQVEHQRRCCAGTQSDGNNHALSLRCLHGDRPLSTLRTSVSLWYRENGAQFNIACHAGRIDSAIEFAPVRSVDSCKAHRWLGSFFRGRVGVLCGSIRRAPAGETLQCRAVSLLGKPKTNARLLPTPKRRSHKGTTMVS